ncbi:hypothetical protein BvCmsNSNP033_04498 [Escherichia coli]|nr:hypothetical protein BvCmsB22A_00968 [Escherichia coli]GDN47236.1 hypothetical protein BvCmsNSNP033_04498 [Escherichia coli]
MLINAGIITSITVGNYWCASENYEQIKALIDAVDFGVLFRKISSTIQRILDTGIIATLQPRHRSGRQQLLPSWRPSASLSHSVHSPAYRTSVWLSSPPPRRWLHPRHRQERYFPVPPPVRHSPRMRSYICSFIHLTGKRGCGHGVHSLQCIE